MGVKSFKPGDWVIVRKQKVSTSPGPRARQTAPASKGDTYAYLVEKYWVVEQVFEDGKLGLRTRRGKRHVMRPDDPQLRKARWWERWLLASRFRAVEASAVQTDSDSTDKEQSSS